MATVWIKTAIVSLVIGTLLFVVGFSTSYWAEEVELDRMPVYGYRKYYGLWNMLVIDKDNGEESPLQLTSQYLRIVGWEGWYQATRVFECLGFLIQVTTLVFVLLYVKMECLQKVFSTIAIFALGMCSVIFMCAGHVIFATKAARLQMEVDWSMGVAAAGTVLTFIAAIMGLFERIAFMYM